VPEIIQNAVTLVERPVPGAGGTLVRLVDAGADHVAGLHAVTLLNSSGTEMLEPSGSPTYFASPELVARVLGGALHALPMWNSEREPSVPMS